MPRLLLVLSAAFVARLVVAWRTPLIDHDGAFYMELAASLRAGDLHHGLSTIWPPLYPVLVAMASYAAGYSPLHPDPLALERAARLVSVLAGTAVVAATFVLARRAAGGRVAGIAAWLAASHPRLIQYSAATLAESCFMLALLIGLTLLAPPEQQASPRTGMWRPIGAGAAFGLAYLARPEGILLAVPALAFARVPSWSRRAGFVAALALVTLPFILWMSRETGHLTLGEKGGYNLWRAFRDEYGEVDPGYAATASRFAESRELEERTARLPVRTFALLLAAPGTVLIESVGRLFRLIFETLPLATHWPWFVLAVFGWGIWRSPPLAPATAVLVTMPLLYAPFSVDRRFLVPAVPLLLMAAAWGLDRLETGSWLRRPLARVLLVLLTAGGLIYALATAARDDAPEHRAAGVWLAAWSKTERIERPIVMSRKTWVAFYAGGRIAELPDGDIETLRARIAANGTDVVIVDERWAVPQRPMLAPLIESRAAPPGFRVVHEIDSPRRLVIYDVRDLHAAR